MKRIHRLICTLGAVVAAPLLWSAPVEGVPRDSNFGNTGGYDSTRVEAKLVMVVKDGTQKVHFVRDNNDPRVVTKTYHIHHIDAYEIRDYLRQMVQSKRVGNTAYQQNSPGNAPGGAASPQAYATATVSQAANTGAGVQSTYSPAVQLGSNTAVECLKYVDGTGLLLVSAEEYRFKDHENGMGIDAIVKFLDRPQMGSSYGTQVFFYLPRCVPARNLLPLIQNVGMNVAGDVTELWQGQDLVTADPELNWLIFDVSNYSCKNISEMLAKYDVPIPQVRLTFTVYEVYRENDERMGVDFQSWKNNEGADFFSVGGRYRNNWSGAYANSLARGYGSERTSFYNFNPKWNTRYLDFLASRGKAVIAHTGVLVLRNHTPASFNRTTGTFYSDDSRPIENVFTFPDAGVGFADLMAALLQKLNGSTPPPAPVTPATGSGTPQQGNQQIITADQLSYNFQLTVSDVSVTQQETRFNVTMSVTTLIGFNSDGSPRRATGDETTQVVSLPFGKDSFVIGGLKKRSRVKSRTGIPYLCEIPGFGCLFSTESTSIKHSELILLAQCEWASPALKGNGVRRHQRSTKP